MIGNMGNAPVSSTTQVVVGCASTKQDVVIVGGGIAGLVAANRALELGLSCTVLEKGEGHYLCNSRLTGGMFHICMRDIASPPDRSYASIIRAVPELASVALARAVSDTGERLVRWLRKEGVRLIKAMPEEAYHWVLAPPRTTRPGMPWKGRAGDVLLRTLEARLKERGGMLIRGARAASLLAADNSCRGVMAEVDGAAHFFASGATVLADGGFQANASMLSRYITPRPESLFQRCAPTGNGDGIRMAEAVGARLVGMEFFYGHVLNRAVFGNPNLWPYPIMDRVVSAGIAVDAHGLRFMDEGRGGVYQTNQIARAADPLSTVAIFDEKIWRSAGRHSQLTSPNPALLKRGGVLFTAPDIESLAKVAGLPPGVLGNTVSTYNDHVRRGATLHLSPPRSLTFSPMTIDTPPFYAAPLCAGITYTMGGIATDESGRVIALEGGTIPGLFAAGSTTGGLEGGDMGGYVGGLAKAGTMALIVAETIGRTLRAHT